MGAKIRFFAAWCVGLLFGLVVTFAAGQAKGEKEKDPSGKYSEPVRVNGVDFEVVAETVWRRPAEVYGVGGANIGLRINNRSDKDLTFDLGDTLQISLKPADGPDLISGPVPRRFLPKPLKVAAGKSETVTLPTHLFHTRIRAVCLGLESDIGWNWLTADVLPGKYRLCLSYASLLSRARRTIRATWATILDFALPFCVTKLAKFSFMFRTPEGEKRRFSAIQFRGPTLLRNWRGSR